MHELKFKVYLVFAFETSSDPRGFANCFSRISQKYGFVNISLATCPLPQVEVLGDSDSSDESVIGSSMTFCLVVLLSASDFPNLHHLDEKLNKPLFILEVSSISPFLLMEREAGSLHGSDLF
jgi:hypothetical protein